MSKPLRVGVICYPTFGGSGVVATELALAMAQRGHTQHILAYARPARLDERDAQHPLVNFHQVQVMDYPVFHQQPYLLGLASQLVDLTKREHLDLVHVHYAVPHATSAVLARDILVSEGLKPLPVLTTLHGTDITLVGQDPSYRPVTRFSIRRSDAVTTPSHALKANTQVNFDLPGHPISVIPNFVDIQRFYPAKTRLPGPLRLMHVSNFRAVKRIKDLIATFEGLAPHTDLELHLVGDGPELAPALSRLREVGLEDRVRFHGFAPDVASLVRQADLFMLPSAQESFGVAALEAMASGVPVIASRIGGLPEVLGDTGVLVDMGDVSGFQQAALDLIQNPSKRLALGQAARERALTHFSLETVVTRYEALYQELAQRPLVTSP